MERKDILNVKMGNVEETVNSQLLPRFEIFGKQALFAEMNDHALSQLTGTDKLYSYDLRHGDDDSIPLTVEPYVRVNRFARIYTAEPLLADGEKQREIGEDDWGFLSDLDDMTPEQFYEEMQKEKGAMREYEIFQLKDTAREYMFRNTSELAQMGVAVSMDDYQAVYKGTLEHGADLESIYVKFNMDRPSDFTGHSLSVSDVIVVMDVQGKTAYFVDSFGFTILPDFFALSKQQELIAENERAYPPLYRHTAAYARASGEIEAYRDSMRENLACKAAIESAIEKNFDGMHLNPAAVSSVLEQFGAERVQWVLGNTVAMKDHDGRFSLGNKLWAQAMNIPLDVDDYGTKKNQSFMVNSHPAILNGFISFARKEMEKPPAERQNERADSEPPRREQQERKGQSKDDSPKRASVRSALKAKQEKLKESEKEQKKGTKDRKNQSL